MASLRRAPAAPGVPRDVRRAYHGAEPQALPTAARTRDPAPGGAMLDDLEASLRGVADGTQHPVSDDEEAAAALPGQRTIQTASNRACIDHLSHPRPQAAVVSATRLAMAPQPLDVPPLPSWFDADPRPTCIAGLARAMHRHVFDRTNSHFRGGWGVSWGSYRVAGAANGSISDATASCCAVPCGRAAREERGTAGSRHRGVVGPRAPFRPRPHAVRFSAWTAWAVAAAGVVLLLLA